MKNILILSGLVAGAVGAYAQGTVNFTQIASGTASHVYSPDTANPATPFQGNISQVNNFSHGNGDNPTGTTVYTGALLGSAAATGIYAQGNQFDAQLFAAAGNSLAPETSLVAVSQYIATSFNGGAATGSTTAGTFVSPTIVQPDPGIPGTGTGTGETGASIELRAWYNDNGTITSWASALTGNGNIANAIYGKSTEFLLTGLGNTGVNPPVTAPNLVGLTSFSLVSATPEPSTIALGVMGACAFILRRRK
jgi:hypothetical protein